MHVSKVTIQGFNSSTILFMSGIAHMNDEAGFSIDHITPNLLHTWMSSIVRANNWLPRFTLAWINATQPGKTRDMGHRSQRRWASVVLPSLTERRARSSKMDVENIGFYDQLFDVLEDLVVRDVHWLRVMVERMKPIFDRRAEWFWSIWTPTPRNSQPYDQGLLTTITPSFLSNVPKRQVNYMNSYHILYIYDHDSSLKKQNWCFIPHKRDVHHKTCSTDHPTLRTKTVMNHGNLTGHLPLPKIAGLNSEPS